MSWLSHWSLGNAWLRHCDDSAFENVNSPMFLWEKYAHHRRGWRFMFFHICFTLVKQNHRIYKLSSHIDGFGPTLGPNWFETIKIIDKLRKPYSFIDKQTLEQNTHPMLVLRKYVNRWRGFCFQIHQRFVVFPHKTLDLFSCQMCLMVWGNLWDPAASKPSQSFNNNKKHA